MQAVPVDAVDAAVVALDDWLLAGGEVGAGVGGGTEKCQGRRECDC